jgi:hypothetical protein
MRNEAYGFPFVYGLLAVVLAVVAFAAGVEGPWKTIPKPVTVTRTVSPATARAVAVAWGKPDVTIPGAQVNRQLTGATCYVWNAKRAVLCF